MGWETNASQPGLRQDCKWEGEATATRGEASSTNLQRPRTFWAVRAGVHNIGYPNGESAGRATSEVQLDSFGFPPGKLALARRNALGRRNRATRGECESSGVGERPLPTLPSRWAVRKIVRSVQATVASRTQEVQGSAGSDALANSLQGMHRCSNTQARIRQARYRELMLTAIGSWNKRRAHAGLCRSPQC